MGRIKSNAVDRLPNNEHSNMKTSTFFALAASCALLASGASAEGPEYYDDDEYHHDPCECRDSCEYVNDYHICYVRDPYECHDAFPSRYYEDEKWIWCPWEEDHGDDWKPPSKKKHHDWDWHDDWKKKDKKKYKHDDWKHKKDKSKKKKHDDWDKHDDHKKSSSKKKKKSYKKSDESGR